MMKFIVLVLLVLLAFASAQKNTVVPDANFPVFAPANSGINVLPLSIDSDEDVALTVEHVFSHDENTLTDDSGVESLAEQDSVVLEDEAEGTTESVPTQSKETVTEEILDDSEVLGVLAATPQAKSEAQTLQEEKMVLEAEKVQSNTEAVDQTVCIDFCKKTGSDDKFCNAHCAKK
jgi:hypothetical protein